MNAPYQQKDLTGSLFRNDRKETDSHPDYKGSALLNGVDHWMDAWINESKDGKKYMSVKFKPKDGAAPRQAAPSPASSYADDDSDIPF